MERNDLGRAQGMRRESMMEPNHMEGHLASVHAVFLPYRICYMAVWQSARSRLNLCFILLQTLDPGQTLIL